MQLDDFALSCARRGGRAIARHIPAHGAHHHVTHMIRRVAYQIAVHSPRVTNLACRWLPIAMTTGIIAGAPANFGRIPGASMLPSSTLASVGRTPSYGGFDESWSPSAASGVAGSGFFQAGASIPMETSTIAATAPEAVLGKFLLPLYGVPIELMPVNLPAIAPAKPMLETTFPDLPAMPFGPVAPASPAVSPPVTVAEVPEPSTAFLLSGSALALLLLHRRKGRMLRR